MRDTIVLPGISDRVVRVGGIDAEINGFDSTAIQMAIDALKSIGGIVALSEGTFEILAPIKLGNNITLTGAGEKTILHKVNGFKSKFVEDADYGELMITVEDASGFKKGMGIQVFDDKNRDGWKATTSVIKSIENNTIYIDNYLIEDYSADKSGIVSNSCSIIEGVEVRGVQISNLIIDGNKANNDEIVDGCRGGAIYFHKSVNCTVENVKIYNFKGDGISWQIDKDVTVRNCEVSGCEGIGIHPGAGSLNTIVEGNNIYNNGIEGLFVCWRVQKGLFRNNKFHNNARHGISIGHKDTDNLFESNHIYENAFCGIWMREAEDRNGAHRNVYRNNVIENNGDGEKGYGILIDCFTREIIIEENVIRDTGKNVQKIGIMINREAPDSIIINNKLSGHSEGDIVDKNF